MRKICKTKLGIPKSLELCAKEKYESSNLLKEPQRHSFDGRCYKEASQDALYELYHYKCGACETRIIWPDLDESGAQKKKSSGVLLYKEYGATIEHYRPKKGGYYWLGYEWTNLFPCCERCNNPKGDKFEIKGIKRKKHPVKEDEMPDYDRFSADSDWMLEEQPYYINPEIDDPFYYFNINSNGELVPANELKNELDEDKRKYKIDRVEKTISIYALNRQPLIKDRKKIIDNLQKALETTLVSCWKMLSTYAKNEIAFNDIVSTLLFPVFEDLYQTQNEEKEFTIVGNSLWANFNALITSSICISISEKNSGINTEKLSDLLNRAFQNFKKTKAL